MKNIINLVVSNNISHSKYMMTKCTLYGYDNTLSIFTDYNNRFDTLINDKDAIKKALEASNIEDVDEFIDSISLVTLDFKNCIISDDKVLVPKDNITEEMVPYLFDSYLKQHTELKGMNIKLPYEIDYMNASAEDIIDKYEGFNIYGTSFIGFDVYPMELLKNYNPLCDLIDTIKRLELSPLETVLLSYDIVRGKIYKTFEGDPKLSRDPVYTLYNDFIVCSGYIILLKKILDELGIKSVELIVESTNDSAGHSRIIVRIDDSKYGIHGLFKLDPTIDSRRDEEDKDYINRYYGFASQEALEKLDKNVGLKDETFEILNNPHYIQEFVNDFAHNYIKIIRTCRGRNIVKSEGNEDIATERKMIIFLEAVKTLYDGIIPRGENYSEDVGLFIKNNLDRINDDLIAIIPLSKILKALTYVRIVENKMNPDKYKLDLYEIAYDTKYVHGIDKKNISKTENIVDVEPKHLFKIQSKDKKYVEGRKNVVFNEAYKIVHSTKKITRVPGTLELYRNQVII